MLWRNTTIGAMPGEIFVNYRRDDARDMMARVRDRLAASFGGANVFMDVDNLLAGQRFDKELEKAFGQTDAFLAAIGPHWMELLAERKASGERDYVREEIAGALQRGIVVIPVLIERTALPRADALPEDIRDLVLHQEHVVTHEQFGRDVAGFVEAIRSGRKAARAKAAGAGATVRWVGAIVLAALVFGAPDRGAVAQRQEDQAKAAAQKAKQDRKQAEEKKRAKEADLLRPGQVFRDCPDVCPEMVVLPAGDFMMGSNAYDSEKPPRKVAIQRPFAVGKFEVTFAEWDACAAAGGCKHRPGDQGWGRGRRPVINVSWHDVQEYAAWLSRKTGKTYQLLSEAEWEYAARAGTTTLYAFGDTISKSQAQYWADKTVEVGSFPANKFGLHDLNGNVWEWVEDNWHPNHVGAPIDGSVWKGGDTSLRVLRGGSWDHGPVVLRSGFRDFLPLRHRNNGVGFRLSRTL